MQQRRGQQRRLQPRRLDPRRGERKRHGDPVGCRDSAAPRRAAEWTHQKRLQCRLQPRRPDPRLGSGDSTVILWDVARQQPIGGPLRAHQGQVWSVAFSPDARTLASTSSDGGVILWDVASQKPIGAPLTDIATSPLAPTANFLATRPGREGR